MAIDFLKQKFLQNKVSPQSEHETYVGISSGKRCECKKLGLKKHACGKVRGICDCCPDD